MSDIRNPYYEIRTINDNDHLFRNGEDMGPCGGFVLRLCNQVEAFEARVKELESEREWVTIRDMEDSSFEGDCWIIYKGRTVSAYRDHNQMYRFNSHSENVFMSECISHAMPLITPQPPKEMSDE